MADRDTKTLLTGLLLIPLWFIAAGVLFLLEFSVWHGRSGVWQERVIEAVWFLSLPIGWIFITRRGRRKSAEEHRRAAEERIGLWKLRRRDDSSAKP